jgi:hypothetical protein
VKGPLSYSYLSKVTATVVIYISIADTELVLTPSPVPPQECVARRVLLKGIRDWKFAAVFGVILVHVLVNFVVIKHQLH